MKTHFQEEGDHQQNNTALMETKLTEQTELTFMCI